MKRTRQYICLLALLLTAVAGQAKTITINADELRGDFTQALRDRCANANYSDLVVLNFGKGTYTVNGTISLNSSVIIKGQGRDNTKIILDKGSDRSGFKAFTDDTFFRITGTLKNPVSISISDVSFKLKEHKGIWWAKEICHAVKIYHANPVNIIDVDSYMENAIITNFDLRVCSNVTVKNCDITNFNNSTGGGCLWLRGEMHDIHVQHNKFTKYGKDEAVAVFDQLVDNQKQYLRGKANRTDIFIEDNTFVYGGYQGKDKDLNATCDMVVSLFTNHKNTADRCLTRNFHLRGNKFYINDICTRCMYIGFDPADEHSDIYIENNEIVHNPLDRNDPFYYCDIEVHDQSKSTDIININGNSIKNDYALVNKFGTTGYAVVVMRGGHVSIADNTIVNNIARYPNTGKQYGIELVWCKSDGISAVNLTGNVCKGLDCVAHIGAWEMAETFSLSASNNYFAGNTRVYCDQIKKLDLNFTGNTFNSQNEGFFLHDFAQKGTVVFDNNEVIVSKGSGQFMTRSSGKSTQKMRFDKLEIKHNVFKGVKNESHLFKNVTNVGKKKVKSNTIRN